MSNKKIILTAAMEIEKSANNLHNSCVLSNKEHKEILTVIKDAKEYSISDSVVDQSSMFFNNLEDVIKIMVDTEMFSVSKANKIMAEIRELTGHKVSESSSTTIINNAGTLVFKQKSTNTDNFIGNISF